MTQFQGEIRDLSQAGLGVVNGPDGKVYFVAGTWPGDIGTFEILSQKKTYGFAKLVSLSSKSPHRLADVPCEYHGTEDGTCGGCPWLAFDYADQLKRKDTLVSFALTRAKLLENPEDLLPILAAPRSLGYRNRAQFKTDGTKLGFVSYHNKTLVDIKRCAVLNDECSSQLTGLRAKLPNSNWQPREDFLWNFVEINDTLASEKKHTPINFKLPFMQGNHDQNLAMKSWLRERLEEIPGPHNVVELFCGSGNFTEVLSRAASVKAILAVEMSQPAIVELNQKRLAKTKSLTLNVFNPSAWDRMKPLTSRPNLLFIDPPREGFEAIGAFVKRFKEIKNVLYVSCSLQTLTRDAAKLLELGFKVSKVQPVDMFPNTPHVEICAHFYR